MTASAARVTPMPIQLVSGRIRCQSAKAELRVMTAASMKRRMPASLVARAVLRARRGTNCRSTTSADMSSIRLSAPKAKSTGLRARHAEKRARAHSTTIQISVTTCNRIIWRDISPEFLRIPRRGSMSRRPVSSSKLIVPVSPPRHILPWHSKCSADPRLWGPRLFSCKNRESQRWTSTFRFGSASLGKNRRPQRRRSALRSLMLETPWCASMSRNDVSRALEQAMARADIHGPLNGVILKRPHEK